MADLFADAETIDVMLAEALGPFDNTDYTSDEDTAAGVYGGEHSAWFHFTVTEPSEVYVGIDSHPWSGLYFNIWAGPDIDSLSYNGGNSESMTVIAGPLTDYWIQVVSDVPDTAWNVLAQYMGAPPVDPPATPVQRWTLVDPDPGPTGGSVWVMPINPNSMSPIGRRRELKTVNGRYGVVTQQLTPREQNLDWTGVIRSQEHYDRLLWWANRRGPVHLVDHLGRTFHIYITDFIPVDRSPIPRAPKRWRYTMKTKLLAGPL